MELKNILKGKRIYLDANIFIYWLEKSEKYQKLIEIIGAGLRNKDFQIFANTITLTEILPPIIRNGEQKYFNEVIKFMIHKGFFEIIPIDNDIGIEDGILRGKFNLKTPDSLHIASAINSECEIFLTNDLKIPNNFENIQVIYLSSFLQNADN